MNKTNLHFSSSSILLYLKRGDPKFTVHLNHPFQTTVANWCFTIHPRQIKLM